MIGSLDGVAHRRPLTIPQACGVAEADTGHPILWIERLPAIPLPVFPSSDVFRGRR
jgi:hypothetical protein